MNKKNLFTKLFLMLTFFVLLGTTAFAQPFSTVYVDATNGSNANTGQNETNLPPLTGPKATLAAALPIIAHGGTIVIKAGTYAEALDFSTGLAAGPTPPSVLSYTLQLKDLDLNTDVVFTGASAGNHAVINKAGLTVTISRFGTTERILTNPGAAKVVTLTAGTINLTSAAAWAINPLAGGELTVTYNMAGGSFISAAPTVTGVGATTGIILNYTVTASFAAGPEASYASFGGIGQININTGAAGRVVTFPGAIAFHAANTLDVINIAQGGGTFPSTVSLGRGDIVNAGGGAVTVTGLVSAGLNALGTADANISSVVLTTSTGSITLTGGITWTLTASNANVDFAAFTFAAETVAGATGTLNLGSVTLTTPTTVANNTYAFRFNNIAGATMNVGTVTSGISGAPGSNSGNLSLGNAGTAIIAGGLYRGFLANTAGTTTVTGATTVNGILTNAATIALGGNTLTLTTSQAHLTNGGTVTASASGGIAVTTTAAGNTFNGGTLSNVTINGAGGITTFGTNAIVITTLNVTLGTGVFAIGTTVTTANVNGGTMTINNGVTVTATDFNESAGVVNLGTGASGVLDVKGNFSRTGGVFTAGGGSLLSFTGTVTQAVNGGPLFQVVHLTLTNSVSPINVANTIRVSGNATISTATTVNFGTVNLVLNSATATITNNGIYNTTAGSGGGVILGGGNLVTLGFAGGGQTIQGTGTFSYITVDVTNTVGANIAVTANTIATPTVLTAAGHGLVTGDIIYVGTATVNIPIGYYGVTRIDANTFSIPLTAAADDGARDVNLVPNAKVVTTLTGVKFNGVLRLFSGGLSVATAGVDFSPFGTSASIVRHMYEFVAPLAAGGVAQPVLIADVGTWNAAAVTYDVEYATGTALATNPVNVLLSSREFTAVTSIVKNLTVSATSVVAAAVRVTAARTFIGNLNVGTGAVLQLSGILTGSAAAGVHVVSGGVIQITPAVGEKLVLSGGGTLTGGAGISRLDAVDFNTAGTYSTTGMKLLGANAATNVVAVLGGAVLNLAMANLGTTAAPDWGNVWNLTVTTGRVNLTGDIDVVNLDLTVAAAQTFDFDNRNVWWKGAGSFNGAATSVYLATGATTGGYLQIRASSGINTGGALVPRIIMDPEAAGTFTLTLGGSTGFSDIFTNTGDDILQLGANTFTLGGTAATWNHGGTATYPSGAGNGVFNVTGGVTANLGATATIPNLTVNNGANTFTLVDNIPGAGVPDLIITDPTVLPGVFTMTAGTITQGFSDIFLNDAGVVFTYALGTINQSTTKGTAATDAGNGELKFNNAGAQTFNVGTTVLSIPNFTVVGAGGVTLGTANPFTVSQRLVMGASTFTFGAVGIMTLADGCWVIKNAAANFSRAPIFAGVIDLYYVHTTAAIPTAFEMPAAGTATLRDLFINMTGAVGATDDVDASKSITVNRSLNLMAGDYDLEQVAATIYTITMATPTSVIVTNGNLVNSGSATVTTLLGGPVTLTYQNTVARTTTTREFPATAGFVSMLNVNSNPGAGVVGLTLHATRSVGDFVLNMGTTVANGATAIFNLSAFTLNVTNPTSATLTRGIIADQNAVGGFYVYGTFNVTGSLTSTANSSIQNLNTTANTAALAGAFGTTDWDGPSPNVLVGVPLLTLTVTSSVAGVVGNITTTGALTINGAVTGNITTTSNITVSAIGALNPAAVLSFNGATGQTLALSAATTINTLNVTQTGLNPVLNVTGANLTIGNIVNFTNGIINMGEAATAPTLILPNPTGAANGGLAFDRVGVTGTRVGHVVGRIRRPAATGDGTVGTNGRFEFPVGTLTGRYRPAQITFTPAYVVGNPVGIIVSHRDTSPEGIKDLPLDGGAGVKVGNYPSFYWLIRTAPGSLTATQRFDIDLQADNIGYPYTSDAELRMIRRQDGDALLNGWSLQGTAANYSNYQVVVGTDTTVIVRTTSSLGGLVDAASRFTIGVPTRAPVFTAPTVLSYTMAENTTLPITFTADPQDVGETVSYSLVSPPAFATIVAGTGVLTLAPDFTHGRTAPYSITVRATDAPGGMTADRTISVTVTNVNRAPVFVAQLTSRSMKNDSTLTFTYTATDADGEALTFTLVPITPAFAGTASVTTAGVLTFRPVFADAGKVFSVQVNVSDTIATVPSAVASITVTFARLKGDVNNDGAVTTGDATLVLRHVVGLFTITGAESIWAALVGPGGTDAALPIGSIHAARILFRVASGGTAWPTWKVGAVNGSIAFGDLKSLPNSDVITVPLKISNGANVLSASFTLSIDKNLASLESITSNLPDGWQFAHNFTEDGKLNIALAGTQPLPDGDFANITLKLANKESKLMISGNGSLNDELAVSLQRLNVRQIPAQFNLSQNYPNPFNPTTTIKYQLAGNTNMSLVIYDMLGRKVRTLINEVQEAGYYSVTWSGTSDNGVSVSSGLYIYRIEAGSYIATKKMSFMK